MYWFTLPPDLHTVAISDREYNERTLDRFSLPKNATLSRCCLKFECFPKSCQTSKQQNRNQPGNREPVVVVVLLHDYYCYYYYYYSCSSCPSPPPLNLFSLFSACTFGCLPSSRCWQHKSRCSEKESTPKSEGFVRGVIPKSNGKS